MGRCYGQFPPRLQGLRGLFGCILGSSFIPWRIFLVPASPASPSSVADQVFHASVYFLTSLFPVSEDERQEADFIHYGVKDPPPPTQKKKEPHKRWQRHTGRFLGHYRQSQTKHAVSVKVGGGSSSLTKDATTLLANGTGGTSRYNIQGAGVLRQRWKKDKAILPCGMLQRRKRSQDPAEHTEA